MTGVDNFLKECKIKTIKGKEYYYRDAKFSYRDGFYKHIKFLPVYIAPVNCKKNELDIKINLARLKLFLKSVRFFYEMSERHYNASVLSKKELKQLTFLRLIYNGFLYKYAQSDLDRYEKAMYTKYVYGTTSIEGNTYTLRETDITLNEGITVGGKEKKEFFEIENYGKLQQYLSGIKEIEFDEKLAGKIHSVIMHNIDDDSAGNFRNVDVGIRGASFEPTPAIFVEEEIKKLYAWFYDNVKKINEIELISLFHQKFEEIHPFKDGNGRVGRELIRIWLHQHGLPTIFIDKTNREEYLKCLDKGNNGDHIPLTKFFYNNIITVHHDLLQNSKAIIEQEIKERPNDEEYNKILRDKKIIRLIKWLGAE